MKTLPKLSLLLFSIVFIQCEQEVKQFSKLSSRKTNIEFENTLVETMDLNIFTYDYIYNGGGVAVGDINNDGLVDIYFSGNTVENKLYLNKGEFEFEDITVKAGVAGHDGWKTGVTMADVNGDGLLDIYVCYSGLKTSDRQNQLFINKGGALPVFEDQAKVYGVDAAFTYSTQANFFDYDKDGDLDLLLVNHGVDYHSSFGNAMRNINKRHPEFGNQLFRNDGERFTDVSEAANILGGWLNYGLSASVSDINGDGFPDIYVSNDFDQRDFLYVNKGDGTFSESLKASFGHISKFTMGTDFSDFNNDNLPDLITLDMLPEDNYRQKLLKGPDNFEKYNFFVSRGFHNQQMRNMLQLNMGADKDGNILFSEIGQLAGISMTDWSWAPLFADFDNDGFKDLFISNGYYRDFTNLDFQKYDFENARQQLEREGKNLTTPEGKKFIFELVNKMTPIKVSNYAFRNTGKLTFENKTKDWGLEELTLTNGATYADLDNDGDLDLITNNINEKAGLFRNNAEQLANVNYIKIKLVGTSKNKFGVGAKVYLKTDTGDQFLEFYPSRGYLSSVDPTLHFGLGKSTSVKQIKVIWPDEKVSTITNPKINSILEVKNDEATSDSSPLPNSTAPIFHPVTPDSIGLTFKHIENSFIDFRSERLLLSQLSQQGPCTAVGDVNQDGIDDIFIGGALGQAGVLYFQNENGTFIKSSINPWETDKDSEDVDALFFDSDNDQDLDLYIVSGGNEYPVDSDKYADRLYVNDGKGNFKKSIGSIPSRKGGGSFVTVGDYDNDGDQDLFVGGWSIPRSYPMAVNSLLLKNESTKDKPSFIDITNQIFPDSKTLGVLHDGIWSDYDNDGKIDLITVGHWQAIRIFKNTGQNLTEATRDAGLLDTNGFWNTIVTGDFDNDGDDDLVVGNIGLNSEFKPSVKEPLHMYWNDFDSDGKLDPIISQYYDGIEYPIATRDELLSQVATMKKKYTRYSQYATATLSDVIDQNGKFNKEKVVMMQSMYFENLGNASYSGSALPLEAQFAPVHAILTGDFNGDQFKDIIVAGNFTGYRAEYGPFDASLGVLQTGNGKGQFKTIHQEQSGIRIKGDVRKLEQVASSNGKKYILAGRNNDTVVILEFK